MKESINFILSGASDGNFIQLTIDDSFLIFPILAHTVNYKFTYF